MPKKGGSYVHDPLSGKTERVAWTEPARPKPPAPPQAGVAIDKTTPPAAPDGKAGKKGS
tara:strand:+ start:85 stop:261 length:177 start_codon:yes stop_codon:yes gene_type:complete